jgi:hypothetical protein
MISMSRTVLAAATLAMLAIPAVAAGPAADQISSPPARTEGTMTARAPSKDSAPAAREDAQLAKLQADFERFARAKVDEMNRNHRLSRSRMQISKQGDGSYGAVFHQIDGSSVTCQVTRSQSKTIPFVAVLAYQEQILAASGNSPDDCRKGQFATVGIIPNRHIFSYHKGGWQ